jgi:hypothetical protein
MKNNSSMDYFRPPPARDFTCGYLWSSSSREAGASGSQMAEYPVGMPCSFSASENRPGLDAQGLLGLTRSRIAPCLAELEILFIFLLLTEPKLSRLTPIPITSFS